MKTNMGFTDRLVRLLLAAAFAALYFSGNIPGGTIATVCWVFGIVFIITSLVGFCPLYRVFGISTTGRRKSV